MPSRIHSCPACGSKDLRISRISCNNCGTMVEGSFSSSRLCSLPDEQIEFIEVFLKNRGNIKDVERELGISYPTVRSRLDRVVQGLGYTVDNIAMRRKEILQALENNEMPPEEAVNALKELK